MAPARTATLSKKAAKRQRRTERKGAKADSSGNTKIIPAATLPALKDSAVTGLGSIPDSSITLPIHAQTVLAGKLSSRQKKDLHDIGKCHLSFAAVVIFRRNLPRPALSRGSLTHIRQAIMCKDGTRTLGQKILVPPSLQGQYENHKILNATLGALAEGSSAAGVLDFLSDALQPMIQTVCIKAPGLPSLHSTDVAIDDDTARVLRRIQAGLPAAPEERDTPDNKQPGDSTTKVPTADHTPAERSADKAVAEDDPSFRNQTNNLELLTPRKRRYSPGKENESNQIKFEPSAPLAFLHPPQSPKSESKRRKSVSCESPLVVAVPTTVPGFKLDGHPAHVEGGNVAEPNEDNAKSNSRNSAPVPTILLVDDANVNTSEMANGPVTVPESPSVAAPVTMNSRDGTDRISEDVDGEREDERHLRRDVLNMILAIIQSSSFWAYFPSLTSEEWGLLLGDIAVRDPVETVGDAAVETAMTELLVEYLLDKKNGVAIRKALLPPLVCNATFLHILMSRGFYTLHEAKSENTADGGAANACKDDKNEDAHGADAAAGKQTELAADSPVEAASKGKAPMAAGRLPKFPGDAYEVFAGILALFRSFEELKAIIWRTYEPIIIAVAEEMERRSEIQREEARILKNTQTRARDEFDAQSGGKRQRVTAPASSSEASFQPLRPSGFAPRKKPTGKVNATEHHTLTGLLAGLGTFPSGRARSVFVFFSRTASKDTHGRSHDVGTPNM